MKILYINESLEVYDRYKKGMIPSHWFYGAIEMENEGHQVIWCKEKKGVLYDIKLVYKHKPDIIFLPNLNIRYHLLLLLCLYCGLIKTPVYAYLHHSPQTREGLKTWLFKLLLPTLSHVFFLSEKNMSETVSRGFLPMDKCSVPGWGADSAFYDKVKTCDEGYFVSTGKENRDFDILIEAFRRTGAPLKIMTANRHAGNDYSDLEAKCEGVQNIEVVLTENSSSVYPILLDAMAKSKAIVCPLCQNSLDYCVGLSSVADAEGLHKPLIITKNPYHSDERMRNFKVVETVDDWVDAIRCIQKSNISALTDENHYSMLKAYGRMKQYMQL